MEVKKVLSFIGIPVPEAIALKIRRFQKEIPVKESGNKALRVPVHITLIPPFLCYEGKLPELNNILETTAAKAEVFEIDINDFGAFPPRVIYAHIITSPMLKELHMRLKKVLRENAIIPPEKVEREFHPHITIASKSLNKKLFAEAWERFSYEEYKAGWETREYVRYHHNGQRWELASRYFMASDKI